MGISVKDSIDVKGISCPVNFARVKEALELLDKGELLEVTVDEGGALTTVSRGLKQYGHTLIKVENLGTGYKLIVKK